MFNLADFAPDYHEDEHLQAAFLNILVFAGAADYQDVDDWVQSLFVKILSELFRSRYVFQIPNCILFTDEVVRYYKLCQNTHELLHVLLIPR